MKFEVVQDLKKAEIVWNLLSPKKVIDDEWQFRYTFYKYLHYPLYFILCFDGDEPVGMLPMQLNTGFGLRPAYALQCEEFLEFFGGDDSDNNDVFLQEEFGEYRDLFFKQVHSLAYFAPLKDTYKTVQNIKFYTNKYYLPLVKYKTYDDFLADRWSGDARRNIKRQIRKLHKDNKVNIVQNEFKDIELLFTLNMLRFGENSSFRYSYRRQIFRDLMDQYRIDLLTIEINGVKEAVSFGIVHKNIYYSMNIGVNPFISNLGKLLILLQIQQAIDLGCKLFDAGKGNGGWKEVYKLNKDPQYKMVIQ